MLNVNGIHGISEIQLQNIISKVAEYKVLCSNEDFEDVDYKDRLIRILEFWDIHHNELSAWWVLVERAYLFQPSSCAAERALSIFSRIMTSDMKNSLIDLSEGVMMLNINHKAD